MSKSPFKILVLISGNGSNLQAIIDQIHNGDLPVDICAVLSNKADAYGLQRAREANIPTLLVEHKDYPDRTAFDQAMQAKIDECQPDLIVLAGFMRILTDEFVEHYLGRMINIHPSLLPDYKGLDTHQRVLDDGKDIHGVSVHYVTPALDDGPVILQSQVEVGSDDTANSLAARVQKEEHYIYPLAIRWIAEGRIEYRNGQVYFDDHPLLKPLLQSSAN